MLLPILECFLSTTGLFRTLAVLRESDFSKGERNIESFGPVADHLLNSSLFNFLQILYHSIPYPFIISNSSTLIKYSGNTQLFLFCWWLGVVLLMGLLILLLLVYYCSFFVVLIGTVIVFIVGSVSSVSFPYSFLFTITIRHCTSLSLLLFTIHLLLLITLPSLFLLIYSHFLYATSLSLFYFIILCCVFSYLLFILDCIFFFFFITTGLCLTHNWNQTD